MSRDVVRDCESVGSEGPEGFFADEPNEAKDDNESYQAVADVVEGVDIIRNHFHWRRAGAPIWSFVDAEKGSDGEDAKR